jgi:cytochrome c peroxidase
MFRNSVSTVNVKFRETPGRETSLLRDGRFGNLNFQVLVPIHTREEMCGLNPTPLNSHIFSKGKKLFNKPVKLTRGFLVNEYTGANLEKRINKEVIVSGIPHLRLNNSQSVPTRNECLALALAKLRNSKYQKLFKDIYKTDVISDKHLADVLASYVRTHTAINAPIDNFIKKNKNLSKKELLGLGIFFTNAGETFQFEGKKYPGAACITCHKMPFFESNDYYSLGVRSHKLSPLSKASYLSDFKSSSLRHRGLSRNSQHNCHQKKDNKDGQGYAPDPGRALYSGEQDDCFKFKVPTLRNVIETYPYFHHGTERGLNSITKDDTFEQIAYKSLKSAISFHLRGPVDLRLSFLQNNTSFLDSYQQFDSQIPFYSMQFNPDKKKHKHYPIKLESDALDALTYFVAYTLRTQESTQFGLYGNDVTHPKEVPSGLNAVTNDDGTQLDFH